MADHPIRIAPPGALPSEPPPYTERARPQLVGEHGRLLEAHEVALEFYHDKRSRRWVLENLHHCRANVPGQTVLFWEDLICAELGIPFPREEKP